MSLEQKVDFMWLIYVQVPQVVTAGVLLFGLGAGVFYLCKARKP